jgi:hypothetical protein
MRIVSAPVRPADAECGERRVEVAISEIIIANMVYTLVSPECEDQLNCDYQHNINV